MRPLRAIAARHEVLAIEVLDPRDVELPDIGDVVLQDAESGVTREFTIDAQLRDDFAKAAAAHRAEVSRTIRSCGAPVLTLRTDRDWIADIVRFVESRRRGSLAGRRVHDLPLLGPMTLSGFAHSWFFLFLLVVFGLAALYIVLQLARQRRMLRFANMELLESVAPKRPSRWRHLPAILLVLSLVLFTIAMAGPTNDVRIPRNRAVVMLVIDVSQSMRATDVEPNRMAAAQEAAKQFADELTPGINLGLIEYAGTATVLVSPTTNREATKNALDKLQFADRTATGEGIFTALQAIATVGAVIGGGDTPPPARIVLFSDGKETMPTNPDNPKGAFTAARTAKDQGVPISTISFGTPYGFVEINDQRQPVPVDDTTMKKVAELSGGNWYNAASLAGAEGRLRVAAAADRLRDDQRRRQRELAAAGCAGAGAGGIGGAADQPAAADVGFRPSRLAHVTSRRDSARFFAVALRATGSGSSNPAYHVVGMVLGDDPDHDPPVTLKHLEPSDVLHVLIAIGSMLVPVVLDRDLDVLPSHVQIRLGPAPFVVHGDLGLWPWKASTDQQQT